MLAEMEQRMRCLNLEKDEVAHSRPPTERMSGNASPLRFH